jgi:hypothetical protein
MEAVTRGRRTATLFAAVALVTIAAGLIHSRGAILEAYYRYRLGTGGEAARLAAIEGLISLDRPGSVPCLLEALQFDPSRAVQRSAVRALASARLGANEQRVLEALSALLREPVEDETLTRLESEGEKLSVSVTRSRAAFKVDLAASSGVPWQTITRVMDRCNALQITEIGFRQ